MEPKLVKAVFNILWGLLSLVLIGYGLYYTIKGQYSHAAVDLLWAMISKPSVS